MEAKELKEYEDNVASSSIKLTSSFITIRKLLEWQKDNKNERDLNITVTFIMNICNAGGKINLKEIS